MTSSKTTATVTIVHCDHCGRSDDLTLHDARFWCGWCQDWKPIRIEKVQDARVDRTDSPRLVVELPNVPLQPLRIPMGWSVEYNNGLYEIDSKSETLDPEWAWMLFKQDMLMLKHEGLNRLLDVGWYPEGDLENGVYGLVVHEGDHRGKLLHEFQTRERLTLVAEIERLLAAVCRGEL